MNESSRKNQPKAIDLTFAKRIMSDVKFGLNTAQIEQRNTEGYVNFVDNSKGKTYKSIFMSNIFTFFNLLTFIVALALILVGAGASQLAFIVIIFANIFIGIFQEIKAKKAVEKLSLITAPTAVVVRNGERKVIPISDIVLDDIMHLELGKQICSDAIVVKGEIEVNESMLTGESIPVVKKVGSTLFSGSFVSSGNCYARVEKVGGANYIETLSATAKKYKKPRSELQLSIRAIIKIVSVFIVPIAILMLVLAVGRATDSPDWNAIISSTSGAIIGMIPAGMFLLTSIALAVSVVRLAKRKTLVQDLYCIEMLARVNVLCLDKTGTITDGTMQVNNVIEIKGGDSDRGINEVIGSMLSATEDNNQTALALADKFGYSQDFIPTTVLPFNSVRKMSAVTFEGIGTYMLGAPEFVLKELGVRIEKLVDDNASNGFRVMVLAHSPADIKDGKLPAVRRPIALIIIEDHIREDAIETVKWFRENDVAVKVISGDNPITVSEVAKRVGIDKAELYISLDGLSTQEVIEAASKYTVFGRVSPEQKSLLIKSMKAKGNTVAMTGDGVNDILAMREADCSIAIASGSEAARNVSHLVLLDSNFTSMPNVVMEGRRVVNNIQKSSSLFLMKTLMSIAVSIITLCMGVDYFFKTSNLLLLEFFVIGMPSFALALQTNKDIIKGKFILNVIKQSVPGGITLVINIMAIYLFSKYMGVSIAEHDTMMVLALTFTGMMVLFKICEPFDAFRTVLMIIAFTSCLLMIVFLPAQFGMIPITQLGLLNLLFLSNLVLLSYAVVTILMIVMKKIDIN